MILFLIILFFQTQLIEMRNQVEKQDAVQLNLFRTIKGDFYQAVDGSIAPDGKIVVYDRGNKKLIVYDSAGDEISSFGKEGNGPYELDGRERLVTTNQYIILLDYNLLCFYSFNGEHVKEVKIDEYPSSLEVNNSKLFVFYSNDNKTISLVYNSDGTELRRVVNPGFDAEESTKEIDISDRILLGYLKPAAIKSYQNGFVQYYRGHYKLEMMDENFQKKLILKRDFPKSSAFAIPPKLVVRGASDEYMKKAQASVVAGWKKATGGFQDDINQIFGEVNGYLFVSTAYETQDELNIDVISPDQKLYAVLHLAGEKIGRYYGKIEHGYLILSMKNDTDGPYLNVYKINLNK